MWQGEKYNEVEAQKWGKEEAKNLRFRLIRYVFATQRNTMVFYKDFLPNMDAFAIFDHDREKVRKFNEVKAQFNNSTYFAFHGTKPDCAYSITRNELVNMSNSTFMTAGAAYGSGIYCTQTFSMAAGYGIPSKFYDDDTANYQVICVIEVVDDARF